LSLLKSSFYSPAVLGLMSLAWLATPIAAAEYAPKVGELHADFTLPNINGESTDQRDAISLSQYRGSKILLIHFASW